MTHHQSSHVMLQLLGILLLAGVVNMSLCWIQLSTPNARQRTVTPKHTEYWTQARHGLARPMPLHEVVGRRGGTERAITSTVLTKYYPPQFRSCHQASGYDHGQPFALSAGCDSQVMISSRIATSISPDHEKDLKRPWIRVTFVAYLKPSMSGARYHIPPWAAGVVTIMHKSSSRLLRLLGLPSYFSSIFSLCSAFPCLVIPNSSCCP